MRIHRRTEAEQIKLGRECLRLRGLGCSLSTLSVRFGVSGNSLQKWIRHFKNSQADKQAPQS